jgi:hypothetical protein
VKVILVALNNSQFEMISKVQEVPDSYGDCIRIAFHKPMVWVSNSSYPDKASYIELLFVYKGNRQGKNNEVLIYELYDIRGLE